MTYIQPLFPSLVLLGLVSFVWDARRRSRASRVALAIAAFGVALYAWPPVAWLGTGSLEWWYPVRPLPDEPAEAIVVLSGYVAMPEPERPRMVAGCDTYRRCSHAAWLYRSWSQLPVVACGGHGYSDAMHELLHQQGVPLDMILRERRSTRTHENALYAAEILRDRGIRRVALVTDAYHMLRAEACFKQQGLDVVPAPCNFQTSPYRLSVREFLPGAGAIRQNEETLHEWVGLLWYWTKGWI